MTVQAQGLAKMIDRALSEILEAEQCFIRNLANFANRPQARGRRAKA
jgi:hypothetical protein